MSDEEREQREAKEEGVESTPKKESTPPPGGWADRGDDETNPRDADSGSDGES